MDSIKDKLAVVPIMLAMLILGSVTLWLFRPRQTTLAAHQSEALPDDMRVMVNGADHTEVLKAQPPLPYAHHAPESLRLTDISYITRRNQQPVLVLTDGSQLLVTPAILETLAGPLRLRLEYER